MNVNMSKGDRYVAIGFAIAAFVVMSMAASVRGVLVPVFKTDFNIGSSEIGVMLLIGSIAYMVFTYFGGSLSERIGHKKLILIGFFVAGLSLASFYLVQTYVMFLVAMFGLSAGNAFIGLGFNTLVPVLAVSFQAVVMNMVHFSFGVGATATQRTTGVLLARGVQWRQMYLFIGIVYLIVFVGFIFVRMPHDVSTTRDVGESKRSKQKVLKNKLLYFYMIALGMALVGEIATSNWFVNYMKEVYGYTENQGSLYLSLFFGIFTVGRLVGGFVAEKVGYIKSVLYSLIVGATLYTIGLVLGERGLLLISASGIFNALIFPMIILTISKVFKENAAYATGIIITASTGINMAVNMIIGYLNDTIGSYQAYFTIPISVFISTIFMYLIYQETKEIFQRKRVKTSKANT